MHTLNIEYVWGPFRDALATHEGAYLQEVDAEPPAGGKSSTTSFPA